MDISHHVLLRLQRMGHLRLAPVGNGKFEVSGENLERLSRDCSTALARRVEVDTVPPGLVDIPAAGKLLLVHPDYVRTLIRAKWLHGVSLVIAGHQRTYVNMDKLEEFNRTYAFVRNLALTWRVNLTDLTTKLAVLQIVPVAGPSIDGVQSSLFRRSDVENVSPVSIRAMGKYPTRAGRKSATARMSVGERNSDKVSVSETAAILSISTQQVIVLLRKGVLSRNACAGMAVWVQRDSVEKLMGKLSGEDWLTEEKAAVRLGCSIQQLRLRWVITGLLPVEDCSLWRLVSVIDVRSVELLCSEYMTAWEAGAAYKIHRSYFPNLERRGLISSLYVGKGRRLRLYSRSAVAGVAERELHGGVAQ